MHKLVSIFTFAAAFLIGAFCIPTATPTIYEKIYPNFTRSELKSLAGKKVVNNPENKNFVGLRRVRGMKYTLDSDRETISAVGRAGETGVVVDLDEFLKTRNLDWRKTMKGCNLLVKWDEKTADGRDMFSCQNRFWSRAFLEFR